MNSAKTKNKLGYGSISLPLFLFALLFSFRFKDTEEALGDKVLHIWGIPAWSSGSSGLHYTILYSILIFWLGWAIGKKFPNDFGSILGKRLCLFSVILLTAMFLGVSVGLCADLSPLCK